MQIEQMTALKDMVLDEPSVIGEVKSFEDCAILAKHYVENMGWSRAIDIIRHCPRYADNLVARLLGIVPKDKMPQLIRGIFESDHALWVSSEAVLSPRALQNNCKATSVNGKPLLTFIFEEHRSWINNDHPLLFSVNPDQHWKNKITARITRKDWRRAWEDLKTASSGYRIGKMLGSGEFQYRLPASIKMMDELIHQLFEGMRKAKLLQEHADLEKSDVCRSVWNTVTSPVFENKTPRAHRYRPRTYNRSQMTPGWKVANQFSMPHMTKGNPPQIIPGARVFSQTGLMALAIARHIANGRNEKRQKTWKRLLNG